MCILSRPEKRKGKVKSQSAKRQKVDASSKRLIHILLKTYECFLWFICP